MISNHHLGVMKPYISANATERALAMLFEDYMSKNQGNINSVSALNLSASIVPTAIIQMERYMPISSYYRLQRQSFTPTKLEQNITI